MFAHYICWIVLSINPKGVYNISSNCFSNMVVRKSIVALFEFCADGRLYLLFGVYVARTSDNQQRYQFIEKKVSNAMTFDNKILSLLIVDNSTDFILSSSWLSRRLLRI
jgi:hypothetical protein